jgi:hypothetical protein
VSDNDQDTETGDSWPAVEGTVDIVTPLQELLENAQQKQPTPWMDGYMMGLRHAIELAKVMQWRIDLRLLERS